MRRTCNCVCAACLLVDTLGARVHSAQSSAVFGCGGLAKRERPAVDRGTPAVAFASGQDLKLGRAKQKRAKTHLVKCTKQDLVETLAARECAEQAKARLIEFTRPHCSSLAAGMVACGVDVTVPVACSHSRELSFGSPLVARRQKQRRSPRLKQKRKRKWRRGGMGAPFSFARECSVHPRFARKCRGGVAAPFSFACGCIAHPRFARACVACTSCGAC